MQEWGFTNPILIDEDGKIIAGHGRLEAAQGVLTEVPTITIDGLTEEQKRALVIADNQLATNAGWDLDLLKDEISTLDFDIDLLGFDKDFIANLLHTDEGLTDPDNIPTEVEPSAKPGDIWILGDHRIMCGDSTSADNVAVLLNGVEPHLMVTDPPYGVEYDANWRNEADRANGKKMGATALAPVANDSEANWGEAWSLFPGNVVYIWHASLNAGVVAESIVDCGFELRSNIIWNKTRLVIGRGHYHWQHEPCWYAVRNGSAADWQGSRKESTIWDIPIPLKSETGHSTQKPVECMRRPIINNSSIGQAIYEPFSGSGTTIIACQMEGRHCYAMEIMPEYVDIAVKRWEEYTGQKAQLDG